MRPGGYLVFETRDPARKAWLEWTRARSYEETEITGLGTVEHWADLTVVDLPLVSWRWTFVFPDGDVIGSESTLSFREREDVHSALVEHGYVVDEIRGAPDRPGREFVFFARRP